jgi:hypothetical protein
MDEQIRRRLNMSDNQGKYECACRTRIRWGSSPNPHCKDCDGTGYTNKRSAKKDWSKDPVRDEDFEA